MTTNEAAAYLKERDNILVITHLQPDGDTLGSGAALCQGLREVGKTAYLLPNPQIIERYCKYCEEYCALEDFRPETVVTVDVASESLFPANAEAYKGKIDLGIDHHASNTAFAARNCVYPERSACGEVVYEILLAISGKVSPETASALYLAVSTDTGCFAYGNTNTGTHRTAAALIEAGAPSARMNKELFRTKSRKRLMLEASIISALEFFKDGRIAVATITRDVLAKIGAGENEADDIASIPGQIEGVIAGVTLREEKNGSTKISLRTVPQINANLACAKLGGGGHTAAAGARLDCGIAEAKERILAALDEVWEA